MFPSWFHQLSVIFILAGLISAAIVLIDVIRRPQHMAVMNVVWPVTALFGAVFLVGFYFRYGRGTAARGTEQQENHGGHRGQYSMKFPVAVAKGALHCGSGCTLGDVVAEWLAFAAPSVAIVFGWQWLFRDKTFAVWILDFLFAFLLGIVFQYFAIAPMRDLTFREGIKAAVKADTFSLLAWQVGMYGGMGILQFILFPKWFGTRAEVDSMEFWFAMQVAMLCGFVTSYPVNWYLLKVGIKEVM